MAMGDQVISMLVEIKNAYLAKKPFIEVSSTHSREGLGKFLVSNSYVKDLRPFRKGRFGYLHIDLSDDEAQGLYYFRSLRILSKPGRRIYFSVPKLSRLLIKGRRHIILSTSKGIMKIDEARKRKLGGEAICDLG